ncbi:MAG: DNA methylase N-4/N-6, partial [Chloroflexi bacterium]|nr:DNA methylase N-4/N-6 [Chloroflexota bacterium]
LWDACVSLDPASVSPLFRCPLCFTEHRARTLERLCQSTHDDLTGCLQQRRQRSVARVYGATQQQNWRRPPTEHDLGVLARIEREPIPACVPKLRIAWGDLHRRGYHHGVSHLHHFYTRRNLIAFSRLWEQSESIDSALRDAIRLWLLSYNASHTTMMTRVVAKSGQRDLVVTSAQSGVLYLSGLPVEKNVFRGLDRKLSTVTKAFQSIHGRNARVTVHQRSSCAVDLPDASVDYVFTDPPFGANIPYSEIAFLNEGWLGRRTNTAEEVVVSPSQRKTVDDYQTLLTRALREVRRILKPSSCATVVFHSAAAGVWNALRNAYTDAGLDVDHAGILDKKQASFKQVTTTGAVRGDPVLLLRRRRHAPERINEDPWEVAARIKHESSDLELSEQTPARLYSRLVTHYLSNHQDVPVDARQFYTWLASQEAVEADRAL